jgi:hypothetical protein
MAHILLLYIRVNKETAIRRRNNFRHGINLISFEWKNKAAEMFSKVNFVWNKQIESFVCVVFEIIR